MSERQRVVLEGEFTTDGNCVYVGGMTLAAALVASVPNLDSLEYQGKHLFGEPRIRVEVSWPLRDRSGER